MHRPTFKPCGSESDLENFPCRRSRSVYPSSVRSVDCFVSPDTVRMLLFTSMDTSSFCKPGSSKVARTVFDLSSWWMSILCNVNYYLGPSAEKNRSLPRTEDIGLLDLTSARGEHIVKEAIKRSRIVVNEVMREWHLDTEAFERGSYSPAVHARCSYTASWT